MNTRNLIPLVSAAGLVTILSACGNLDRQQVGTGTGAVLGGAAGSALTGSTLGTIGGAAAGGVIGSEMTDDRRAPPPR
jgi:osmotically inducible lipoprotein OsmB